MARRAEGWKLDLDTRTGIFRVRFTHNGKRYKLTTGKRDPGEAAQEAPAIYAEIVSGRPRPSQLINITPGRPLDELAADWLVAMEAELDPATVEHYEMYVRAHWQPFFCTVNHVTEARAIDYTRARLRVVLRETVKKELSALRRFCTWAKEAGIMPEVTIRNPPTSAIGRRDPLKNSKTVPLELEPEEVERILAALPVRTPSGPTGASFWCRPIWTLAWETSLRHGTLAELRAPDDYACGRMVLRIRDEIDKARFGRELPLSKRARAVLDEICPDAGLIFGRHNHRTYLKAAGVAVLGEERGRRLSPHDFRHACISRWAETGNLPGIGYLAGHLHATTTDRYVRRSLRQAENVLAAVSGPILARKKRKKRA